MIESQVFGVNIGGRHLESFAEEDLPTERIYSDLMLSPKSTIEMHDIGGRSYCFDLPTTISSLSLSVRLSGEFACQSDCLLDAAVTEESTNHNFEGPLRGLRFQPFFFHSAREKNSSLSGKGLFFRGFHFVGTITSSDIYLACICDRCDKSFLIKSTHMGVNGFEYAYSDSGVFTLFCTGELGRKLTEAGKNSDLRGLREIEREMPRAPDETRFRYLNPFRCKFCGEPYIDFHRFPNERAREYYGNVYSSEAPIMWGR